MSSRLQQLFGLASPWILQPQRSGLICASAWLLTLPLTWQHPWMAFLGFIAIWGLSLVLWIEGPLLQIFPLPPLTVLVIGLCLRWGLGPLLLAVAGSGGNSFVQIWIRYGPLSQLLWLTLTSSLLLMALYQRDAIANATKSLVPTPLFRIATTQPQLCAQLRLLAWILSIYMAAYLTLSVLSGVFDHRHDFDSYVNWTKQLWRLDTPVAAFSRLRDIWFFLLPLWWRLLGFRWRLALSLELITFLSVSLLAGSRGLLFYPVLLVFFGLWFVIENPRHLRRLALFLSSLFLILSPIIYVLRENPNFYLSGTLSGRVEAAKTSLLQTQKINEKFRWLGRDLYACHDPYLFTPENRDQPPAGFKGLDALLYLWIPKHVQPERPVLFDGHLIAKDLQRVPPSAWSQVWFPCFSLPADLMRRWALPGVLLGSLLVSGFVHVLFRIWYRTASISGTTFQLILFFFPATYLQSFPFGTVSETAWVFLWELPKYLFVFWVMGVSVDHWLRRSEI